MLFDIAVVSGVCGYTRATISLSAVPCVFLFSMSYTIARVVHEDETVITDL